MEDKKSKTSAYNKERYQENKEKILLYRKQRYKLLKKKDCDIDILYGDFFLNFD